MTTVRYPRVRDGYIDGRLTLIVTWAEGDEPRHYCGDTWCTGGCGTPALIIPEPNDWGRELKARSSMTARGPVMQPWAPKTWTGAKAAVPDEHRDTLMKAYWR